MLFTTDLTKEIPDPTETKEQYELFLKKQRWKNFQNIVDWKTPNNSETKLVRVRNPKYASNFLKACNAIKKIT